MSSKKKVFWPISPTDSEPQGDENLKNFLKTFSDKYELEIYPIYVIGADYFITSEYFEPIDIAALKKNMEVECANYLENFSGIPLQSPLVLENQFSARGAEVKLFKDFVEQEKPDFVVMNSHGRSGWVRAFLGSFTESFLLQTQTPTIVIGPQATEATPLKSALMPVQLNESSQKFIEKFLDDHRLSFLESLTLFHKISMVDIEEIAWAPTLYGLNDFSGNDVLEKARETTDRYLKSFLDHPLSQKRLHYKVSEKLDAVASVVVEEANNYDVVVMRTEAGTLEANLLGSVTRDVIRNSKKPVIVYPHKF